MIPGALNLAGIGIWLGILIVLGLFANIYFIAAKNKSDRLAVSRHGENVEN